MHLSTDQSDCLYKMDVVTSIQRVDKIAFMARVVQTSKMVVNVGTDYSGMRTFEQILVQLLHGVQRLAHSQVGRMCGQS